VVPPGIVRLARTVRPPPPSPYGYFGDYPTFAAAMADCKTDGYSDAGVVAKVSQQTRELRQRVSGADAPSLDARVFQNLAATLVAMGETAQAERSVLDFGGGLGIHYFHLRRYLGRRSPLRWVVCETVPMAEEGAKNFASDELSFISTLEQAPGPFDVLISSGALQCVPEPTETLVKHAALSSHVLFNRLPLIESDRDRLTIQKVHPSIYAATMPIWFFSKSRWLAKLDELGFDVTMRWEVPQDVLWLDGQSLILQGLLARRRPR
jgi:putative methyltransferase (TIGR04325 family)